VYLLAGVLVHEDGDQVDVVVGVPDRDPSTASLLEPSRGHQPHGASG
jgi:hypothetical protein